MKCFSFSHVEKQEQEGPTRTTKPTSSDIRSSTTSYSTDYEPYNKRSAAPSSELTNSSQTTNVSADSIGGGAGASSSFCRNSFPSSSRRKPCSLRAFTFEELRTATRNFSRSLMIGEGGFGGVYRGVLRTPEEPNRRIDIAVKQLSRRGLQGHKEWATEVNYLGVIEHPNLVKLIGYCAEDDDRGIERLLVYEFMHNRSVQDHLCSRFQAPLPWSTRLKIAQDAARGLSYLHEGMDFQIIFRDFKSSNILLDDHWTAKLSDFGLARLGPEDGTGHVSTEVVGTVGYAAPEYIQTGRLTAKSDVWSYGVFLYELITGRRPFDRNRPRNEQKLLDYIKPHVSDPKKFEKIIDPRLQGRYSVITAQSLGAVANKCLGKQPRLRPKMSQVLDMVTQIVDASENGSTATPQLSLPPWENSTSSSSSSNSRSGGSKSKRERLRKRIFVDPITGENRWLTCLVCVET